MLPSPDEPAPTAPPTAGPEAPRPHWSMVDRPRELMAPQHLPAPPPPKPRGLIRRIGRGIYTGFCLLWLVMVVAFAAGVIYFGGLLGWQLGHRWHGTAGGIVGIPIGALLALGIALLAGAGASKD